MGRAFRWTGHGVGAESEGGRHWRGEEIEGGTLLTVVESGFDNMPASRRAKAFEMNSGGWAI